MAGQPLKKFRAGGVSCALFENDVTFKGQTRQILKACIQRRYKDRDGNWKSTTSFDKNEVAAAIFVLMKAYAAMVGEEKDNGDNAGEEAVM